jgi:hypothetical protein
LPDGYGITVNTYDPKPLPRVAAVEVVIKIFGDQAGEALFYAFDAKQETSVNS